MRRMARGPAVKAARVPLSNDQGEHIGWAEIGPLRGDTVTMTAHLVDPAAIAAVGASRVVGECELWP
jgi:hypothetical protein